MSVIRKLKVRTSEGFNEEIPLGSEASNVSFTSYDWNEDTQTSTVQIQSVQDVLTSAIGNIENHFNRILALEESKEGTSCLSEPISFSDDNINNVIVLEVQKTTEEDEDEPVAADEEDALTDFYSFSKIRLNFSYAGHAQKPIELTPFYFNETMLSFDVLDETTNTKTTLQFNIGTGDEINQLQISNVKTATLKASTAGAVTFNIVEGLNNIDFSLNEVTGI
jgi:hypothetical protein